MARAQKVVKKIIISFFMPINHAREFLKSIHTSEFFTIASKWNHYFKGAIFNKLPLLKHIKIREVIGIKAMYGSLRDENNPYLNLDLLQFPTDSKGKPTTFIMDETPYIETSFGLTNIFKFLRIFMKQKLINFVFFSKRDICKKRHQSV